MRAKLPNKHGFVEREGVKLVATLVERHSRF
jgi:hypothetical protein